MRANIPNGKGEHAAELLDTPFPVLLIEVEDNFGVGRGMKLMTALLHLRTELSSVVGFAVVRDPEIAVGAGHRLTATLAEVDDGKTRVDKQARSQALHSLAIGPAMRHGHRHALGRRAQRLSRTRRHDSGNSAHAIYLPPVASCQRAMPRACLGRGTGCGIWASFGKRYRTPINSHR